MLLNRNEFIMAFAFALDFLEMEFRENTNNHNRRTGLIAAQIGKTMGLNDDDVFDLSAYAMLHDNGITNECYNLMTHDGSCQLDCTASHCLIGETNLAAFPFLKPRENIIKYHHEAYDGSGCFGLSGTEIPLFSQIISLSETVEVAYSSGADDYSITRDITNESGLKYSPELIKAFETISRAVSFWLSLDVRFLDSEIQRHIPVYNIDMEFSQLLPISEIMSRIIDLKSPFTANHSKGLTEKNKIMCDYYGFDGDKKTKMIIASDLHDIGKLAIPNQILDKRGKLTEAEFHQIKSHVFYTRKIIESVKGFEDIAEWASNHHEKLDGTGYPFGFSADKLSFESRLMGCLDIYQALTEDRPYRKGLSHDEACNILEGMTTENKIDGDIFCDIKNVMGN